MDDKKVARINELYHKSKSEGLTPEELKEQQILRKEYIDSFKRNLRGQLNNISIKEKDGSITDICVSNISHISAGRQESRKETILLSDLTSAEIKAVEALVGEAMRVIKAMPKWKPGTQDGKPMRVRYSIPINFRF